MAAVLIGVYAEPEATAEPQNYVKPVYPAPYDDNCHPRKAPKCSKNGTETLCFKDYEYPDKEIRVSSIVSFKDSELPSNKGYLQQF